jgi:hypothetical protein
MCAHCSEQKGGFAMLLLQFKYAGPQVLLGRHYQGIHA